MLIKKSKKIASIGTLTFLITLLFPLTFALADDPPTPKEGMNGGVMYTCVGTDTNGKTVEKPCSTFEQLMNAVRDIVSFATTVALSFSIIVIVIAGWTYLTSGGEPGKRQKANDMFVKVAWGVGWILAAWLVINLIMTTLTGGTGVPLFLS